MIKGILSPDYKHRVYIDGKRVSHKKSLKYIRIGYTGFAWDYRGAGAQQLAFAILLALTNERIARSLLVEFTNRFISKLPQEKNFSVSKEKVMKIITLCAKHPAFPDNLPPEKPRRETIIH